jgi:hypothetical protein
MSHPAQHCIHTTAAVSSDDGQRTAETAQMALKRAVTRATRQGSFPATHHQHDRLRQGNQAPRLVDEKHTTAVHQVTASRRGSYASLAQGKACIAVPH